MCSDLLRQKKQPDCSDFFFLLSCLQVFFNEKYSVLGLWMDYLLMIFKLIILSASTKNQGQVQNQSVIESYNIKKHI